ncbi:MAG TPA: ATP-binding protein [Actinophytocola sp.]|jgi:anti-sigma regulatory factor (Ser/Thr protein kinase)|nr:ATP-binding protein [Actinophytocola sp.]
MADEPAEVVVITGELTELSRVRQWARRLLADLDADMLIDALAVVDELTSNALRHGEAPYRVHLHRTDGRLRVEVADGSTEPAAPRTPAADGGRGLLLVQAYSLGWGQEPHDGGKVVWAELDLASAPSAGQEPANAAASGS